MPLNSGNIQVYGDTLVRVHTAALSVTSPVLTDPAAVLPFGWYDVGWMDPAGLAESSNANETKKYGLQGGGLLRVLRNQFERPMTFTCLEENAPVLGLTNPYGVTTTTGSTANVQTLTIAGTPTGGAFTITSPQFGAARAAAYNVAPATLQTALQADWDVAVVVTGTAGTSYVLTFPANYGALSALTVVAAFTGGTTPTATFVNTTAGVNGVNVMTVKPVSTPNLRQFALDLVSGTVKHRYWYPSAEAVQTGDTNYKGDDFSTRDFTLNPYAQSDGSFYTDINNNPMLGAGLYA